MANEDERQELQRQFPLYIVRAATDAEIDSLHGKTWDQMEKEAMDQALKEHGYENNHIA